MTADGLENAKKLIESYKGGQLLSMTPELWHAKKVVDSTLHPGMFEFSRWEVGCTASDRDDRYWRTGVFPLPHVMFRPL